MDDIVLSAGHNDRDLRMESDARDTLHMATLIKCKEALPGLVVPHFDEAVIAT